MRVGWRILLGSGATAALVLAGSLAPAPATAARASAAVAPQVLQIGQAPQALRLTLPITQPGTPTTSLLTENALAVARQLPVKGRAPKTGYERERFGQPWADTDRNGCDQRNDVLRRDLQAVVFRPGTRDCLVESGTLYDTYTGKVIRFVRGPRSADVQIDHVVALSDAWQSGAQQLTPGQREAMANDFLNLVATHGPTNASKGDANAASWLPPSRVVRCAYVARQVAVKDRYGLWVTAPERDAIEAVLLTCPNEPLPQ